MNIYNFKTSNSVTKVLKLPIPNIIDIKHTVNKSTTHRLEVGLGIATKKRIAIYWNIVKGILRYIAILFSPVCNEDMGVL